MKIAVVGTGYVGLVAGACLAEAPVVFDGRNIYSPEHMRSLGFTYFSIVR